MSFIAEQSPQCNIAQEWQWGSIWYARNMEESSFILLHISVHLWKNRRCQRNFKKFAARKGHGLHTYNLLSTPLNLLWTYYKHIFIIWSLSPSIPPFFSILSCFLSSLFPSLPPPPSPSLPLFLPPFLSPRSVAMVTAVFTMVTMNTALSL